MVIVTLSPSLQKLSLYVRVVCETNDNTITGILHRRFVFFLAYAAVAYIADIVVVAVVCQ